MACLPHAQTEPLVLALGGSSALATRPQLERFRYIFRCARCPLLAKRKGSKDGKGTFALASRCAHPRDPAPVFLRIPSLTKVRRLPTRVILAGGIAASAIGWAPSFAAAPAAAPPVSIALRETFDVWDNVAGGVRTGVVALNKLQISGTVQGEHFGFPGFSAHAQAFRTDGSSLSERVGDIQTASNIEALPTFRLFESWIDKRFGDDRRSFAIRAGLMDLNSDFDSVQAASLFINSSHGIGPDLSRSGRNGPSIFPVSALGVRLSWLPSTRWTFRVAAFDGVPGDPQRPRAFVSVRLAPGDGALTIAQADYHISENAKIEVGAWRYSASTEPISPTMTDRQHDKGFYASIEGPIPGTHGWSAWLRAGAADRQAQSVSSYLGGGVVSQGLLRGRPDDRLGLAIARAGIGAPASAALGVSRAETTLELSYQYKVHNTLAVQPDVQWINHPAGVEGARSALVLGLRIVLTTGFPRQAPATDAADPTVPPDGPQPTEPSSSQ